MVDPVRLFTALYCGTIALQLAIHFREQLQYFRTDPARLHGPPPLLLGSIRMFPISERVFQISGAALILALLFAALGWMPRISLITAVVASVTYFPPILPLSYLRRKANLIPIVLAILALSSSAWTLALVRVAISTVYLSAGVEKLGSSGFRWLNGRSLQAYLAEAFLYNDRRATRWVALRPTVCRLLSCFALFWELTFPVVIFIPRLGIPYAVMGLFFHLGTFALMRINYLIYFLPVYFVFIVPLLCTLL